MTNGNSTSSHLSLVGGAARPFGDLPGPGLFIFVVVCVLRFLFG